MTLNMPDKKHNIDGLIALVVALIEDTTSKLTLVRTKTKRYEMEAYQAELIFTHHDLLRLKSMGHTHITDTTKEEK